MPVNWKTFKDWLDEPEVDPPDWLSAHQYQLVRASESALVSEDGSTVKLKFLDGKEVFFERP